MSVLRHATFLLAVAAAFAAGSARAQLWDPGFYNANIQTEFTPGEGTAFNPLTLLYNQSGAEGCLFSVTGIFSGCGGHPSGAPTFGTTYNRTYCGGSSATSGASFAGCTTYASDNHYSLNSPGSHYWVVVANSDPGFDQCRSGPPGASYPVIDPFGTSAAAELYNVGVDTKPGSSRLWLNIALAPAFHQNLPGCDAYQIPFLSVGAQMGRGNTNALGNMWWYQQAKLNFKAELRGWQQFSGAGHAGIWLRTSWGGKPRMVFFQLMRENNAACGDSACNGKWNWPVSESFMFPGGDIAIFNSYTALQQCGISIPEIPRTGATQSYSINTYQLFQCASNLGLFDTAMPANEVIPLEGAHWFIESEIGTGVIWLGFSEMDVQY